MPPVKIDIDTFSSILGAISITAWVVVFTPQIWTNFATRSADGLSLSFVVLWLIGDFFNIFGAVLQSVEWVLIILAIYYTVADIVLLFQCILYRKRAIDTGENTQHASVATPLIPKQLEVTVARTTAKSATLNLLALLAVCMVGTIAWYVGAIVMASRQSGGNKGTPPSLEFDFWGQASGWFCAVLYLGSRLPQIVHNFKRSSTSGLSPLFFLFACLGNITYVGSIVIRNFGTHYYHRYLAINASWLAGSAGTLLLDFIILAQTMYYNHINDQKIDRGSAVASP